MNSLPLTTLGMNTALYNTYVMVVFLLSLVMLKEKATLLKVSSSSIHSHIIL